MTFFKRGQKVNVNRVNDWLYPNGFVGIVEGSYYSMYGGDKDDKNEYSLFVLNKDGEIENTLAWVQSNQMTEVSGWDRNIGRDMIEDYENKED